MSFAADQVDDVADQRQLDEDEVAEQVGEAGARGGRCLLGVDQPERTADLEVVAQLEGEARDLADLAQDLGVLVAVAVGRPGSGGLGIVSARACRSSSSSPSSASSCLIRPPTSRIRGDRIGGVLACLLGGADRVGGLVALGAEALDLGQQLPPAQVELEQLVELLGRADAGKRRANRRRVLADGAEIKHRIPAAEGRMPAPPACGCSTAERAQRRSAKPALSFGTRRLFDLAARVLADERARPSRRPRRRRCSGA